MVRSAVVVLGNDNFKSMRFQGGLYIDKTRQIHAFLQRSNALLFTRPRRFGKSLLLSTIEELYRGDPSPFAGMPHAPQPLWLHNSGLWDWDAEKRPVFRLDMRLLNVRKNDTVPEAFNRLIRHITQEWGVDSQFTWYRDDPALTWEGVLQAVVHQCQQPVYAALAQDRTAGMDWSKFALNQKLEQVQSVFLVDEYDAPILNHLHRTCAGEIREHLADFYGVFKIFSGSIHKLVMVGITRFVREGLWSKLNHVSDATQEEDHHDLVGFTENDLDVLLTYAPSLPSSAGTASRLPLWRLKSAWQEWYNGYLFVPAGTQRIYNPFAIMNSLHTRCIRSYWAQSGRLTVIEKILQEPWPRWEVQDMVQLYAPRRARLEEEPEIDLQVLDQLKPDANPNVVLAQLPMQQISALLHQAGYLTLREDGRLTVPNREVAQDMGSLLLAPYFADSPRFALDYIKDMYRAAKHLHIPDLVCSFNSLLHQFPHQRFSGAGEKTYNILFDMSLMLMQPSMNLDLERSGLQGDADTVWSWDDVVLVVEFKHEDTAQAGFRQLLERNYARFFADKSPLVLVLALNIQNRQVQDWICDAIEPDGTPQGRELTETSAWPPTLNLRQHFARAYMPNASDP